MTRKAVIKVGHYTVKEGPTGGWSIYVPESDVPLRRCEDKTQALATAKRYVTRDTEVR